MGNPPVPQSTIVPIWFWGPLLGTLKWCQSRGPICPTPDAVLAWAHRWGVLWGHQFPCLARFRRWRCDVCAVWIVDLGVFGGSRTPFLRPHPRHPDPSFSHVLTLSGCIAFVREGEDGFDVWVADCEPQRDFPHMPQNSPRATIFHKWDLHVHEFVALGQ